MRRTKATTQGRNGPVAQKRTKPEVGTGPEHASARLPPEPKKTKKGKARSKGASGKRVKRAEKTPVDDDADDDDDEEDDSPVEHGYNPDAGDCGVTVQEGLAEWMIKMISANNRVPVQDRVDIVASKPRDKMVHVATMSELPSKSRENIERIKPLRLKQREIFARYKGPRDKYSKIRKHHVGGAIATLQQGNKDVTMRPVTVNRKGYMTEIVSSTKTRKLTPKLLREKLPGWIGVYLKEMLPDMHGAPFNATVFDDFDATHMANVADLARANLEAMYRDGDMDEPFTDVRLAMV